MNDTEINSTNQSKGHAIIISFIFLLLFSSLFAFETSVGELGPLGYITSIKIKEIFNKYYIYSGIIIAISTIILFFILNILTKLIKNYKVYFQLFLITISLLLWYIFANQLVYHENRYADIAKAIISYIGYPLLVTITDFITLVVILLISIQIILFLKYIILGKILKRK